MKKKSKTIEKNHWEKNVYSRNKQLNLFPFPDIVSFFKNKRFKNKSKIRILEIGCGAGNNLAFLAEEGFDVSGIDMSNSAIKFAKKTFSKKKIKCNFQIGNIKKINWPNNYFNFVLDRAVLTHNTNEDISIILDEIRRVLKKSGHILSFDFFGNKIPDIKYGSQYKLNTFHNFKKGHFKTVGKTSFFDYKTLNKLFNKFNILDVNRLIKKNKKIH